MLNILQGQQTSRRPPAHSARLNYRVKLDRPFHALEPALLARTEVLRRRTTAGEEAERNEQCCDAELASFCRCDSEDAKLRLLLASVRNRYVKPSCFGR